MDEKLISYKLCLFCKKCGVLPTVEFAYKKGLGCIDALLTIYHRLQKSLYAGMESNIVQLDFIAAFDRESQSGLLFKLKSNGVSDSMLSVSREFFQSQQESRG